MKNSKSYLFLAFFMLQLVTVRGQIQLNTSAHDGGSMESGNLSVLLEHIGDSALRTPVESALPAMNLLQESRPTIAWVRQINSLGVDKANEKALSTAIDSSGNIIIVGSTGGSLFSRNIGGLDAFVAKFDAVGKVIWANQFGSAGADGAVSVAVDKSGNTYVAGYTTHILSDNRVSSVGMTTFIRKYDSSGREVWTIQFSSDPYDEVGAITLDVSGNVYVVGSKYVRTEGHGPDYKLGFLSKYDSDSQELWSRVFQFPDSSHAKSVVVSGSGDIHIGGQNIKLDSYPFGDTDALLKKYSSSASETWTRKFGAADAEDSVNSVAVDSSGNIYVAGRTGLDVFLRKYDSTGTVLWTRQFGAYGGAEAFSVSADVSGNIYLAGYINNYTRDLVRSEGDDAFVRKYDSSGNELWAFQFGTTSRDVAYSVAVDGSGNIYVAGLTEGAFPGEQYPGNADAFLVKVVQPAMAAPTPAPSPTPSPSPSPVPAPEPLPLPAPETPPSPEEPPPTEPPPSEPEPSQG